MDVSNSYVSVSYLAFKNEFIMWDIYELFSEGGIIDIIYINIGT